MEQVNQQSVKRSWMGWVLLAAGIYNLGWGTAVIFFPTALFRFAGMELPRYSQIWQCVGMIVGVYGIGYLIAASDPLRHWPITLVGLLGKIFGPIGFASAVASGDLPLAFGATIVTNDAIWWVPFAAILYQAFRRSCDRSTNFTVDLNRIMASATSHRGSTLDELSRQTPTLVVFLRHAGCTFCLEAVADLARQRQELESRGVTLAIVHMSQPLQATQFFTRNGLGTVHRFSDPACEIYRAFGLQRGSFWQLFGPKVWMRGFIAGMVQGYGIGPLSGDGFRLAGAFLLGRGRIVSAFRSTSAADRPNYLAVACSASREQVSDAPASEGKLHELAAQL